MDATSYAAGDLKKCLEGLARHLFGMFRVNISWEKCTWMITILCLLCDFFIFFNWSRKQKNKVDWGNKFHLWKKKVQELGNRDHVVLLWNRLCICFIIFWAFLILFSQFFVVYMFGCKKNIMINFSGAVEMRWVDTYFPFTNPSFELEIFFQVCWWLFIDFYSCLTVFLRLLLVLVH